MSEAIVDMEDAEALILGLGLFATGGGGLASRGRRYMEQLLADGLTVRLTPVEEVEPDVLTCSVYGMGSIAPHPAMTPDEMRRFGVEAELHPRPWVRAVEELETYLGRHIGAIVPFELGPSNTLVAVDAAARLGRVLVDGDYIGRALPKMSQALPAALGLPTWPLTICDPWGNALIMKDCPSPAVAERVGKMVSKVTKAVDMAASCSHAAFPLATADAARVMVRSSLSRALGAGRRVREARRQAEDPVAAALDHLDGVLLFVGRIDGRDWQDSAEGYMEGTTHLTGTDGFSGSTASIWFQNEHHVCRRDGEVLATSPDIIGVVRLEDAEPLSNTEMAEGMSVAVLGFRADPLYRSGEPLRLTEPRHYGFDIPYRPLEELAGPRRNGPPTR